MKTNLNLADASVEYYEKLFPQPDELYRLLDDTTNWRQETVMMFGKRLPQPRLTAWYGDSAYTYSGLTVEPQEPTETIRQIQQRVESVTGAAFNSVLLNQYRTGQDSVGWHSDDERGLGPVIASVSFGAPRRFQLREILTKKTVAEVLLGHGDLLVMGAGTQENYHHQVPKTARQVGPRINLTFRTMG